MKKIYFFLFIIICAVTSFAQTFPNAGFETWRNSTSGSIFSVPVHAPVQWYSFDSLTIADGETLDPVGSFNAQLFQDTVIKHSGTSSAKMITLTQPIVGLVPGTLTNAIPAINITAVLAGAGFSRALSYSGGTPVSLRIHTVSAWVQYIPGRDSVGMPANDTGIMLVEALSYIGGKDSVIGIGTMQITPTGSSFIQITDSIVYTDTVHAVDTIRVAFASSGGGARYFDSSTLYADDVTMAGVPEAVHVLTNNNDQVKVYPNPAYNTLNIDCPKNAALSCELFNISGQLLMSQKLSDNSSLNVASLAAGMYFYTITDEKATIVQRGKVVIAK